MSQLIFIDGAFVPKDEAKISVYDHGFLYGDGVFEGMRVYSGNVFRMKDHLERLYNSAKAIMLEIPYTVEEVQQVVIDTLKKNNLDGNAYVRLVVSRGKGNLGLDPASCKEPSLIVIAEQLQLYPVEFYEKGLEIVTVATRRNRPDALNPKIKSLNYLNNILIKLEAKQAGVSEALTMNTEGYIAEGSSDNIFLVKKGVLYTPPGYIGALEGITREAILDVSQELGYKVKEEPFTRHDVYVADEVFLTGTAAEVIAVVKVDGRVIGDGKPGEHTLRLLDNFHKLVKKDGVKVYPEDSTFQVG